VQCDLCPKFCIIGPGQSGECRVRVNVAGQLQSVVYGFPCAIHNDPIEKKPLFHFLPGSNVLSTATVGCNLHCLNCQNWQISQANPEDSQAMACSPGKLVSLAQEVKAPSIAYTYTDPVVYYEYTLDTARLAHQAGLRNVLVSAGYINPEPWRELLRHIDAANIDLKSMSNEFYQRVCGGTLTPVLDAIIAAKDAGVWVEITHLVIPTLNDNPSQIWELANWMRKNLGSETPLHFSGFFPKYKMKNLPPTPLETLERARRIAQAQGLKHVYIGNVMSDKGQHTMCGNCEMNLIDRSGYRILANRLHQGLCPDCDTLLQGVWQ
jgi:pyruvate formate lyase activating enzyme